jgi:hypothetical protein
MGILAMHRRLIGCFSALVLLMAAVSSLSALAGPQEARALYEQGYAAYRQGREDAARQLFEQATQQDPNFGDAYYNLGMISYRKNQWNESMAYFQRARQSNPSDESALYFMGLAQEKMKLFPQSIQTLSQVSPQFPYYAEAQNKISRMRNILLTRPELSKGGAGVPATNVAQNTTPYANTNGRLGFGATTPPSQPTQPAQPTLPSVKLPVETVVKNIPGPSGLVVAPDGSMYVASFSKNSISKVDAAGRMTPFVTGMGLDGPVGLVLDPRNGNLYVANFNRNNVLKVSPQGRVSVVATGLKRPYMLSIDTMSNTLFVTESESSTVSRIHLGMH